MRKGTSAFTLVELLSVIAIIAILMGILLPVMRVARDTAQKTACAANFRNVLSASNLYFNDYDDHVMPVDYQSATLNSLSDRTWVQLLLPYTRSFAVFRCPSDYSQRPKPESTFDQDLVPGDTYSRFYQASQRSDVGYNFLYFSPAYRQGNIYLPVTKSVSQAANPSQTLTFVDSLWGRDESGRPTGGGNYKVVPPCRFEQKGQIRIDSFKSGASDDVYTTPYRGWDLYSASGPRYGGAWPWHDGRMNVGRLDGGSISMRPSQLTSGCDVRSNWTGLIRDAEQYMWDMD